MPSASPLTPPPAAGSTVELVCLKGSFDVIRGRLPPHGDTIIVRTGLSEILPVPGEIFRVEVERSWVFGHTAYVKGLIAESRLDVVRLELPPLGLQDHGMRDPEEEAWLYEEDPSPLYDEIRAAGPRPEYEMEQVLPEDAVELHWEDDPIVEAAALFEAGARHEAADLLGDLLSVDLRCLDAHAHLGLFELDSAWPGGLERAERHYRAGVAIGEQALPRPVLDFRGLLPWDLIDNRPFLRCLHGHGLCRWRRDDFDEAAHIFRRLVWLAPHDGLGARFNLAQVEAGRAWERVEGGR
jgi:hypothetical protein